MTREGVNQGPSDSWRVHLSPFSQRVKHDPSDTWRVHLGPFSWRVDHGPSDSWCKRPQNMVLGSFDLILRLSPGCYCRRCCCCRNRYCLRW